MDLSVLYRMSYNRGSDSRDVWEADQRKKRISRETPSMDLGTAEEIEMYNNDPEALRLLEEMHEEPLHPNFNLVDSE